MVKCPFCGTIHAANTLFCGECGTYLLPEETKLGTDPLVGELDWVGPEVGEEQGAVLAIRLRIGEQGREVEIPVLQVIHLGRLDPASDIFPEVNLTDDGGLEKGVSRRHARILKREGLVLIEDLGSINGTFVNGKRLASYRPERLYTGDLLQLGKLLIEVEFKPGRDSEMVPEERELDIQRRIDYLFALPEEEISHLEGTSALFFRDEIEAFIAELKVPREKEIAIHSIKVNYEQNGQIALQMLAKIVEMSMKDADHDTISAVALATRDVTAKQPLKGINLLLQVTKPGEKYVHPHIYRALGDLMGQEASTLLKSLETLAQTVGKSSPPLLYWISKEMEEGSFKSFLEACADVFSLAISAEIDLDLERLIGMLERLSERAETKDLLLLYQTLFCLLRIRTVSDISTLRPPYPPDRDNIPLPDTMQFVQRLAEISSLAQKSALVENAGDKIYYLMAALTTIDGIKGEISTKLPELERDLYFEILARWRDVILAELEGLRGRAVLQVELLTSQALPGEQVTFALKLLNTGQAPAENVRATLELLDDYEIVGVRSQTLAGIPAERSAQIEFTVHPRRDDHMRVKASVIWDDLEHKEKRHQFADMISFVRIKKEFTHIRNPYIAGNPIASPKLFFGRQDVFNFVLENLMSAEQMNTLVLHGQRRTGKSSILLQLRDRILPQEFVPVYINMEAWPDVKTMDTFLARLAYEISRAARKRGRDEKPGIKIPHWFWAMIRRVFGSKLTTWISESNIIKVLPPQPDASFSEQPAMVFDHFIDAVEDALSGQRFVVMFDEFELIESKITQGMDAGVLNYLRNLMQHRNSLIFIFTGTHRLQEMTYDYWSIFFSIALNREISFLSEEDTRRLIVEPVKGNLEYDDLTIEKIIRVTHCQPYLVQLICWELVNYLNGQKRKYATINDLNQVLYQTLVTAEAYFNNIWEQSASQQRLALALLTTLLYPGKETASLSEIERGLTDKGVIVARWELIATLDRLCHRDVLEERTNGEVRYRFQVDMVRMWVEKNKPLSRVLIEEGL
jgi:pSer/pThr/pTyr-binding forkhead associated (FHA) protein/AAA+ ATPase superfamily predicted ATPase